MKSAAWRNAFVTTFDEIDSGCTAGSIVTVPEACWTSFAYAVKNYWLHNV